VGGGQLQAADVERVVQSHRAFVKRQCWEPALSAKAPNSPSSARVVVSINVARDGSVQNANTTGGDGYPGLASCVQGQVNKWKFPPSEGSTVNVPFIFAAQ
jgi:TonB family protein